VAHRDEPGLIYYYSPLTEAFSPQLVRLGITQDILAAFSSHVEEEQRRLEGDCPDCLLIVTKGGDTELRTPSPGGRTPLDILTTFRDNVVINTSIAPYPSEEIREALEPGARSIEDRLRFMNLLQESGILARGALVQPIFFPFEPGAEFFSDLVQSGVRRVKIELATTNFTNLAVVAQVIGWFDPDAQRQIFDQYLQTEVRPKGEAGRRTVNQPLQLELYTRMIQAAREAGMENVLYCRYVQDVAGLPPLTYKDPDQSGEEGSGGCMAYPSPLTPEAIRRDRRRQSTELTGVN